MSDKVTQQLTKSLQEKDCMVFGVKNHTDVEQHRFIAEHAALMKAQGVTEIYMEIPRSMSQLIRKNPTQRDTEILDRELRNYFGNGWEGHSMLIDACVKQGIHVIPFDIERDEISKRKGYMEYIAGNLLEDSNKKTELVRSFLEQRMQDNQYWSRVITDLRAAHKQAGRSVGKCVVVCGAGHTEKPFEQVLDIQELLEKNGLKTTVCRVSSASGQREAELLTGSQVKPLSTKATRGYLESNRLPDFEVRVPKDEELTEPKKERPLVKPEPNPLETELGYLSSSELKLPAGVNSLKKSR